MKQNKFMILGILSILLLTYQNVYAKKIVIRYAGGMSMSHHITQTMEHFAKLVTEKSEERVKVELYPASELFSHKDLPTAISSGAVDFAEMDCSKMGGLSEVAGMSTMSFLFKDWEHTIRVHEDARSLIDKELESHGTKLIFFMPYGKDVAPITVDKQINKLDDLKGLKIRGIGEISSRWLEAAGASSTYISSPEVYHALSTGAIDGAMSGWGSYYNRKWYEVSKYILGNTFNHAMFATVVNLKKWKKLPQDIQNIIIQAGKEAQSWELEKVENEDNRYMTLLEKEGIIINYLSPEELEKCKNLMEPIYKEWASRTEGTAILMKQLKQ